MRRLTNLNFHTSRLFIRPTQFNDLDSIFAIHSNDAVNRYIPYQTWQTRDDALAWFDYIEERRAREFAEHFIIQDIASGEIVGGCLAFDFHKANGRVEFGYVLGQDHWGQGYMYEALLAFIAHLQGNLELSTLVAKVDPENKGSLRLLEKLGFQPDPKQSNRDTIALEKHFGD